MRVLLAPTETAGVAHALRHGLRAQGHEADLWVFAEHPFMAGHDRLLPSYRSRLRAALRAPRRYDVLHFQFGTTLAEFADVAYAHVVGRPLILMHYWGDDCRIRTGSAAVPAGVGADWFRHQRSHERVVRRRLRLAGRLCAAAIVSDLELAGHVRAFFKTVYVVPTPLVLPLTLAAPSEPLPGTEGPLVLHGPSDRVVKGTAEITAAMAAVAARRPLRSMIVSGVRRETMLGEVARADIVIDQLNSCTSGVFALEAMALGKPVLLQLDPELLAPFARDTPLVKVTAQTLEHELETLVADPARRQRLGAAGRTFVHRHHAAEHVAGLLETVYRHARNPPAGLFAVTVDGIHPLDSAPT